MNITVQIDDLYPNDTDTLFVSYRWNTELNQSAGVMTIITGTLDDMNIAIIDQCVSEAESLGDTITNKFIVGGIIDY
jgi:hypothetical protein